MNKITVIGSSSSGNCYLLECSNGILIIEAGISFKEIKKALDYNTKNIVGCLVSHRHLDHAKYIPEYLKNGVEVNSCLDTAEKFKGVQVIPLKSKADVGGFKVQAFELPHGETQCYGYLIEHEGIGRLLFCTDCSSIPYIFKNISHYMIEANNSSDVILENMMKNKWNQSASDTHMSIEKTIEFLKANFTGSTQSITLLHLSESNSDELLFKERVISELGFSNVHIAKPGELIELNNEF